jgi:alpha-galactosidase
MRRQVLVQLTTIFLFMGHWFYNCDVTIQRKQNKQTGRHYKAKGKFLLLLTMNVLKFYEYINVIINGAHFMLRFSFNESRV